MRPDITTYFLQMAMLTSTRATCCRRQVGCILVNERNHVIGTGYNGTPAGTRNCTDDDPCPGGVFQSGEGLDKCRAVHAEANALLQCKDVWEIKTAYTTVSPCIHCVKLLMNTSCETIVFSEEYPHVEAMEMWESSGGIWILIK